MDFDLTLRQRHYLERTFTYVTVFVVTLVLMIPMIWGFLSTVRPSRELFSWPPVIVPTDVSLDSYRVLLAETQFVQFFINSLAVAIMAMIFTLLIAVPAAYSISRYEFHGRQYIANLSTFVYMFPLILLGIPLFIIFNGLELTNSRVGLALAHSAFALPFALLLLRVFFNDIAPEIEESAKIIGASRYTVVREIVLPLSMPGIIATMIFTAAVSWNEYFFALIILSNSKLYTLPLGIANLIGMATTDWGMIMAGVMAMVVPPTLLIFFLYKYLIKGFGVSSL
jgi:ABC-type glycerol-3-phosphate transport system permease component